MPSLYSLCPLWFYKFPESFFSKMLIGKNKNHRGHRGHREKKMINSFSLCLCVFVFFIAQTPCYASPETSARRLQAHLLIGDYPTAAREARTSLQQYPEDPLVLEWVIRSLASSGNDSEMMHVWEKLNALDSEKAGSQDLLEEMCWGIINKGRSANGYASQWICLVASAVTQDMRAVGILLEGLRNTNAQIRAIAIQLAAHYGDQSLREELGRLLKEEKVHDVRVELIKAIGQLQLKAHLPELIQSIAHPKTLEAEKLAAIEAIIEMRAPLRSEDLQVLAKSRRAGLRQLCCEMIASFELEQNSSLLLPLMKDSHSEVRASALKAWGVLRKGATDEIKRLASDALDPVVGITASWVWLLEDPESAEKCMMKWLTHSNPHVRAVAAAAVADSGSYGIALAKKGLEQSDDVFVKINLARALAGQREECELVCQTLEKALLESREKWMMAEDGIFRPIEKSKLSHSPAIANYPEVINQTVRLEIVNLLAILESPKALEALKSFLKGKNWKVTGLAAETLLGEGDESAMDLVRELLNDPDKEIRLEAALVLASWGKDPLATQILIESYSRAERPMQLKILESLGRIGDKKTIPFFLKCMQDPSLSLRMAAASMLIQTLST